MLLNFARHPILAPNLRRYASEIVHESRGSAFGLPFNTRTVRRTRNLALAP